MEREEIGKCTMILGDAREFSRSMQPVDSIITDPVWPNCPSEMLQGANGGQGFLLEYAISPVTADTVVIVLGFDSDPRFLLHVPERWGFIRSQQLPYAMPGYRGRLLGGDEVAYAFGKIPVGTGLIPGRAATETKKKHDRATSHPCPRSDLHMEKLVGWWSPESGVVYDPFMGTGATAVACVNAGRSFIGCEVERKFFDIACKRVEQAQSQQRMFI